MERKMNKAMMIVASAVVAAATTWAPAAQAKGGHGGGGMKMGGGGSSMKFSGGHKHHHHFRVFRRDTIIAPSYKPEAVAVKRIKPVIVPAGPVVKYADGKGRVYDVGSKVWCDGNKHCWTGDLAWTFKDGTWFYGTSRWYEVGGVWKTDAANGPMVVDCETIPAFATLKPTTEQAVARKEIDNEGGQPKDAPAAKAPIKTVETSQTGAIAAKPTECKKYFASVGGMVTVPCEG
jgi:hypothetical protein